MNLEELFSNCVRDHERGCLLWTGPLMDGKYGGVYDDNGVRQYVHRYVWAETNRPLLKGECVRHTCDTNRCCEPDHLIVGSHDDNMKDMARRGRSNSKYPPELILSIRRIWSLGKFSQTHIARVLNLPQTTVSQICRRARWKLYEGDMT